MACIQIKHNGRPRYKHPMQARLGRQRSINLMEIGQGLLHVLSADLDQPTARTSPAIQRWHCAYGKEQFEDVSAEIQLHLLIRDGEGDAPLSRERLGCRNEVFVLSMYDIKSARKPREWHLYAARLAPLPFPALYQMV
eukprot:scaffold195074_cov32-Tisochrysis_lutea.AAC.4